MQRSAGHSGEDVQQREKHKRRKNAQTRQEGPANQHGAGWALGASPTCAMVSRTPIASISNGSPEPSQRLPERRAGLALHALCSATELVLSRGAWGGEGRVGLGADHAGQGAGRQA